MILMEGLVLLPPERGTILGRALWKPRYVVLGTESILKVEHDHNAPEGSGRGNANKKGLKAAATKPSLVDVSHSDSEGGKTLYITIYKAKGEWELLQQHPLVHFKSAEIRNVQHRKQSPSLPTLMLEMKSDPMSEKARKRRSSRTGGLGQKDPWTGILLFRSIPEERYNIYDWQIAIKPLLTLDDRQLGPISPSFQSFTNPFAATRDLRSSSSSTTRPDISRSTSNAYSHNPGASQDRPSALISPSPSLRSRRSDLSSQASSQPPLAFSRPQNYTSVHPTDLPSPASTSGYDTQFIEGWTSAQGRSSALSTHTRGSNSIASAVAPPPLSPTPIGSTPPGPRETILDRAFQMRCIPGSERINDKEEEKISSIARFEALMREVDERKQAKAASQATENKGWKLDEQSDESDMAENDEEDDDDVLSMSDQDIPIPTPAQRALDYISGRRAPPPNNRPLSPSSTRGPPIPFLNDQAMSAFHGGLTSSSSPGLRPRAGITSSINKTDRPSSMAVSLVSRSISSATIPTMKDSSGSSTLGPSDSREKRRSSTSVKRLSFQEFAKRLSSSSSLLLVQTNASSSSGRVSSEYGQEESGSGSASGVGMRGGRGGEQSMADKRCGWRGSVGVFGGEGGFL